MNSYSLTYSQGGYDTATEVAASDAKSACLEKVLYLGRPQDRTFRYADSDLECPDMATAINQGLATPN